MAEQGNGKRHLSYLDVALEALSPGGMERLREADPPPSKRTLRLAVEELEGRAATEEAHEVALFARELYPSPNRTGRAPPGPGEERPYRVQEDTRGSTYVRIPPHVLGTPKGSSVLARFEEGRIELLPGGDS